MKLFNAILFTGLLSANIYAVQTELDLSSSHLAGRSPQVDARYSASTEANRAFLVVTLSDQLGRKDEAMDETYRIKIDGLSLDASTGNIVLQEANKKHICAYPKNFLGSSSYKITGNCKINFSNESKKVDDGFELKNKMLLKVNVSGTEV